MIEIKEKKLFKSVLIKKAQIASDYTYGIVAIKNFVETKCHLHYLCTCNPRLLYSSFISWALEKQMFNIPGRNNFYKIIREEYQLEVNTGKNGPPKIYGIKLKRK